MPLSTTPHVAEAERRPLTVLFCDLVDSTLLATQLDPEDYRTVVRAFQEGVATVVQRFEGHIAQHLGDGLLVYFGWPQAHEDDARRAVHTGLGILEVMASLQSQLERTYGIRLAVRLGIHTGLVVVGAMGSGGRQEQLALGEVPNIAARLQGLAAPDAVLISEATYRLVQGAFTLDALGPQALKGVAVPLQVYRVVGESPVQSRPDEAGTRGVTPLVGRTSEVALLLERWQQRVDGQGQVVLLGGEAGIGKSRLVQVLREHAAQAGSPRIAFRCSAYHTSSALYPVIKHVERLLQFHRHDTPDAKLVTLERTLEAYGLPLAETVPLLAALLSLPLPERYPPLSWSPQRQRQKTHEALVTWLLAEAARQPVLVVWEDLHWADPSTLELLTLFLDQAATARLLTLLTFRPDFRPPWPLRAHLTQLSLNRLTRPQVEELVRCVDRGSGQIPEVFGETGARTSRRT